MRVLVTGGAGFIGSYLVPKLVESGMEVVVFDMASEPKTLAAVSEKIIYIRGDLASPADLYRAMLTYHPEGIFHLGAILAGPCENDPVNGFKVNFLSTQTLLDSSLALKVKRFFMVSSISVFGRDVIEPVTDHAVKNPETIYGQTKLASEHLMLWYARKHGLDTRGLRFTWVFGPGRTQGITAVYSSLLLDAIARGKSINIINPDEKGDWLYVKDAVKAILMLWNTPDPKRRIYNVAGGAYSIKEVVEIAKKSRPDARIILQEGGKILSPYPAIYDDANARSDFGWSPDYTIESAVQEHLGIVAAAYQQGNK